LKKRVIKQKFSALKKKVRVVVEMIKNTTAVLLPHCSGG
jgi:hypothetical protein